MNRQKVKKIKKFGKAIKSFCRDLGIDKEAFYRTLGVAVMPKGRHVAAQIEDQSVANRATSKMQSELTSFHTGFDTGKAALLAYTNLDQVASTDDMEWHKSPNTRNTIMAQKSADISATVISQGHEPIVPSLS